MQDEAEDDDDDDKFNDNDEEPAAAFGQAPSLLEHAKKSSKD